MTFFETLLLIYFVLICGDIVDWSGWWIVLVFFLAWGENILIAELKEESK